MPAAQQARATHAPTTANAAQAAATDAGRAVPTANIAIAITMCIGPAQFGTASPSATTRYRATVDSMARTGRDAANARQAA